MRPVPAVSGVIPPRASAAARVFTVSGAEELLPLHATTSAALYGARRGQCLTRQRCDANDASGLGAAAPPPPLARSGQLRDACFWLSVGTEIFWAGRREMVSGSR
jgi:hypothetical protein